MKLRITTRKTIYSLIILLLILVVLGAVYAGFGTFRSGDSYYLELESLSDSARWSGLKITNDAVTSTESNSPFATFQLNSPIITSMEFPGSNFKDGLHYYAAMFPSTFNASNLENVSITDLNSEQLFSSTDFPVFYPNYDSLSDNPKETFDTALSNVMIAGVNYTAFHTTLATNIDYYLLKYNDGGTPTPLFLASFKDQTCYNTSSCVSEFMLPLTTNTSNEYNFYILSMFPQYTYTTWIDGTESVQFPQTGQPYNLTVEVRNLYTNAIVPGMNVLVGEDNGQSIFVPYRLSGYVSKSYAVGMSDANGKETFLAVPTYYGTIENYSIYVAVLLNGQISSREDLSIGVSNQLVSQSKPITNSNLSDNAKDAVNVMSSINYYLYKWVSADEMAVVYDVTYELSNSSFTTSLRSRFGASLIQTPGNLTLKTGSPNVINVTVTNSGVIQSGYQAKITENDGYLIISPYTGDNPLTETDRYHSQQMPTGTKFIVCPTKYGPSFGSTAQLQILNSGGTVIDSLNATIDRDLDDPTNIYYAVSYEDDLLKDVVNAMSSILYSLYYALNF